MDPNSAGHTHPDEASMGMAVENDTPDQSAHAADASHNPSSTPSDPIASSSLPTLTHTPAAPLESMAGSSAPPVPPTESLPLSESSMHVYAPPAATSSSSAAESAPPGPEPLDDSFFEPTLSDVQAHHASVLARSKRLNEAPLLTSKHRDEEREEREKRKATKWPGTTIRVRFSDGTIIQNTFPSASPIQPVYAFVRSALDASSVEKPFVLWQPPRTQYPERPAPSKKPSNPYRANIVAPANYGPVRGGTGQGLQGGTGGKETLNELGLVPQSVLLVKWEDEDMNVSSFPAPILPELKAKSEPLPEAKPKEAEDSAKKTPQATLGSQPSGEKKMPKWLQKGLMKRK